MVRFWLVIFSCARLLGLCLSARTPGCPPVDPGIQCIRIDAQCKSDSYCKIDEACCDIPCGTKCIPIGVCEQREYEGTCGNLFARFRYDSSKKKCTKFAYSGCNGNDNNFKTLDDCDKACKKSVCLLPKDTGQCKRALTRYYYNTANRKCEKFIYHGCHGNGNNFLTEKGCKRLCTNIASTCPPDPPCPRPPPPPTGACQPPCIYTYGVINGLKCKVKCELGAPPPTGAPGAPCPNTNCPKQGPPEPPHPPSTTGCEKGIPLANVRCDGPGSTSCPKKYFCKGSVCCLIPCKYGEPHPTLSCGQVAGSNTCPAGYGCLAGPADEYFACCPNANGPVENKPGRCPENKLPEACIALAGHRPISCDNDFSCPGKRKCCISGCYRTCVDPE